MKNELENLWKKRASFYWKDAIRYLRVIVTGYMYLPIILLILLAYVYHYILTHWSQTTWVGWIFALILSIPVTRSRIRTFLFAPDPISLLPVEDDMRGSYFRLSGLYSFVVQLFMLSLLFLLLSPLLKGMIFENQAEFYRAFSVLVVLSGMNLFAGFQEQRLRHRGTRTVHGSIRWVLNTWLLAGLFQAYSMSYVIWLILFGLGLLYYIWLSNHKDLFWSYLVEVEQSELMRFYRFAGVFMDVPHLPVRVKRRSWLIRGIERVSFTTSSPYYYLFLRSFVRYQDIFSLYYRLLILSLLFLFFVDHLGVALLLFFLFLYINGMQLTGSWKRVKAYFWDLVYPLTFREKVEGFSRTVFTFLLFQVWTETIILGLQWGWGTALGICIVGMTVSYLYAYPVLQKKLKETEQ